MEEYTHIGSVPPGNVGVELNTKATIKLPNNVASYNHFVVFYKIYVSGQNESGQIQLSTSALNGINYALAQDYQAIYPSTDVTSSSANTAVGNLFRSRGYYELYVQDPADLNNIDPSGELLSSSTQGETLEFEFPAVSGSIPTLTISGGKARYLLRSRGNDSVNNTAFRPLPDRYFRNYSDLNAGPNTSDNTNLDVAGISGTSSAGSPRYTYVSLYIIVAGRNETTFANEYSKPTHIAILKLPEPN